MSRESPGRSASLKTATNTTASLVTVVHILILIRGPMPWSDILFLLVAGLVTGLIDSIAGGGGLISVPAYMLVLGPGVEAVATNKISALFSTVAALFIYHRSGFVNFRTNKNFLLMVFVGACCGAGLSRFMPPEFYRYMMVVLVPLTLYVLFQRQLWTSTTRKTRPMWLLCVLGFLCGVYDGIAGPGGGTLMFLSLFVVGGLSLTLSIGTAKLANVFSASSSLMTYVAMGKVQWLVAIPLTLTIVVGALVGARYASRDAAKYARYALAAVSIILLFRILY